MERAARPPEVLKEGVIVSSFDVYVFLLYTLHFGELCEDLVLGTPVMRQSCSILILVPSESLTEGFPVLLNALVTICFYSLHRGDGDVCVCLSEGLWFSIFLRATILRLYTYIFIRSSKGAFMFGRSDRCDFMLEHPTVPLPCRYDTAEQCLRISFLDSEDWAMLS